MAHKKKTTQDTELQSTEPTEAVPEQETGRPPESVAPAAASPVQGPSPKPAASPVVPKKRIRFRPSQKKKLSVAVLCTNPMTRRFI